jgi:hypothetical protein
MGLPVRETGGGVPGVPDGAGGAVASEGARPADVELGDGGGVADGAGVTGDGGAPVELPGAGAGRRAAGA